MGDDEILGMHSSKLTLVLNSLTHQEFVPRTLSLLCPAGRFVELGKIKAVAFQTKPHFSKLKHVSLSFYFFRQLRLIGW